jgi:hypothetical protein
MVQKRFDVATAVSFGNVRRDAHGGPLELRRKAEPFVSWKA